MESEEKLIIDDKREHINLMIIGAVNSGKSTLSGQILLSCNMVDNRTLEKCEKEAIENNQKDCAITYLTDQDEEERQRNVTIDIGRAYFKTDNKRFTLLDCPGHKCYIGNMLNGASQADIAILIITARKGDFEGGFTNGQTKENALLAKTSGVKKLIVAINKMDDITVNWDKSRYDDIKFHINKYLNNIGFNKKDIIFIPISGITGCNIKSPICNLICDWYKGDCLLKVLDSLEPLKRSEMSSLRIPVLDKYKENGKLIILGKIETGICHIGDELICTPNNIAMLVHQIHNEECGLSFAKAGENIRIVVKVLSDQEDYIVKGNILSHSDNLCKPTTDIVAKIFIIELPDNNKLFTTSSQCMIHIGTAVEEVKVSKLLEEIDKSGKTIKKTPIFILEKSFAIAHLSFNKPLCVEKFDDFEYLGRFTLRNEGKTIGFGKILATHAPILVKKNKK